MRVTLDTSIYVAALNFGGRAARLLGMAQAGTIRIDISDHIEAELVRVVREDFAWEGYRLHFMKARLARFTHRVVPTQAVKLVDDPNDDRIIEYALAARSDFIVTNDNTLLPLEEYEDIEIVRLSEYFERQGGA